MESSILAIGVHTLVLSFGWLFQLEVTEIVVSYLNEEEQEMKNVTFEEVWGWFGDVECLLHRRRCQKESSEEVSECWQGCTKLEVSL